MISDVLLPFASLFFILVTIFMIVTIVKVSRLNGRVSILESQAKAMDNYRMFQGMNIRRTAKPQQVLQQQVAPKQQVVAKQQICPTPEQAEMIRKLKEAGLYPTTE